MRKVLVFALVVFSAPAFGQSLEPGEWEFTSTMTSPMIPKPQTGTFRHCIKKEDADNPERWMGQQNQQSDCKVKVTKKSADGVSWEMSCPKSNMTGTGTARIGRGTMQSEMSMSGDMQGRKFEMNTKMSGKRLGACKT